MSKSYFKLFQVFSEFLQQFVLFCGDKVMENNFTCATVKANKACYTTVDITLIFP